MRVLNPLRTLAVGLLALLTAGCSESRHVRITGDLDRPTVSVLRTDAGGAVRACVDWIAVFDSARGNGLDGAVWRVRSADGRCLDLESITYGRTPDGFVVDTPPQTLRADVIYEAGGHGWTGGFASVPWYGAGRYIFTDGAWQPATRSSRP